MTHSARLSNEAPAIATLCARLRTLEAVEAFDAVTVEAISDAQEFVLTALGNACPRTLGEVTHKIAAIARRACAADGVLTRTESAVLLSACLDLSCFDPMITVDLRGSDV